MTRPVHIAIAIEQFNPTGGGNERSTAQIIRELAARGHQVTVLAAAAVASHDVPCDVQALGRKPPSGAPGLMRYAFWADRQLHCGGFDTSLSVTMTVPAAIMQPRGGTVRETLERNVALRRTLPRRLAKRLLLALNPKQQALLSLERRTLHHPRVKRIVAISDYVARQLVVHYHVPVERMTVIPNAASMPTADAEQRRIWRCDLRDAMQIPADADVYAFAAHNPRLKGFSTLVDAVAALAKEGHKPIVLLAGAMSFGAQRAVQQRGLQEAFRFLGNTNSMAAVYAAADVTVLPTFYDPSSKVVIESLMLGVPAITTRYNGAASFVLPPDGPARGRVIDDPADSAALARAMRELADPQTRAACAAATAGLSEQLSMARHVDQLEHVLVASARSL